MAIAADPAVERDELRERSAFLEDRIATQYEHAGWWWGGWLGFYTMGGIVQGWRAMAATETNDQGALGVSAVKALFGITRLSLVPHGGYRSFDALEAGRLRLPDLRAQVREGEEVLVHNARTAAKSKAWYAHAGNVGINLLGAVIVATAFDDPQQGFIDAGIGVAVGEVHILTGPWEPDDDLEEYEERFATTPREHDDEVDDEARLDTRRRRWRRDQPVQLTVAPYGGGVMVLGRF